MSGQEVTLKFVSNDDIAHKIFLISKDIKQYKNPNSTSVKTPKTTRNEVSSLTSTSRKENHRFSETQVNRNVSPDDKKSFSRTISDFTTPTSRKENPRFSKTHLNENVSSDDEKSFSKSKSDFTTPTSRKENHRFSETHMNAKRNIFSDDRQLRSKTKSDFTVTESFKTPSPYSLRTRNRLGKTQEKLDPIDEFSDIDDISETEITDSERESSYSFYDSEYDKSPSQQQTQNSSSSDESDDDASPISKADKNESKLTEIPKLNAVKRKGTDLDYNYEIDIDEYFLRKNNKKLLSSNSISKLKTPHFPENELHELLTTEYTKHEPEIKRLMNDHKHFFPKWLFYLTGGFNLVMYGVGSKINLLNQFRSEMLSDSYVLTVNGFFPGLTIKEILSYLMLDIFEQKQCPTNVNDALNAIKFLLTKHKSPVFVIIHNIDGLPLRKTKSQQVLSKLASFSNLHMIASIDHINAPSLWSASKLSLFNFLWIEVSTLESYVTETSFGNTRLQQGSSDLILSSLTNIFKALTSNAKKIFKLIAEDHLDNKKNKQYKGINESELYTHAKALMLVSAHHTLVTQLREFKEHKIIIKDQSGYLRIPIHSDILKKFCEQQFEGE